MYVLNKYVRFVRKRDKYLHLHFTFTFESVLSIKYFKINFRVTFTRHLHNSGNNVSMYNGNILYLIDLKMLLVIKEIRNKVTNVMIIQ